jgi:hypothetical protein
MKVKLSGSASKWCTQLFLFVLFDETLQGEYKNQLEHTTIATIATPLINLIKGGGHIIALCPDLMSMHIN